MVASSRARGLKHARQQNIAQRNGRVLTGAWIETRPASDLTLKASVASSRARGLKQVDLQEAVVAVLVASSRARGLKLVRVNGRTASARVASSRARGLKQQCAEHRVQRLSVASSRARGLKPVRCVALALVRRRVLTGAWIETGQGRAPPATPCGRVLTGAWIETRCLCARGR